MNGMTRYYISRALASAAFGGLFALTGSPWWMAALVGAVAYAFFLWAPRSGRYVVTPELGITALRRDEHTQRINDKAGRNAFVLMALVLASLVIYYGNISPNAVPVRTLSYVLLLGAIAYFATDTWLRRA